MDYNKDYYHSLTEAELVDALRHTDKKAFNELILRYGVFVMGRARRLTGNEDNAAEIFQNVFMIVFHKIQTFEGKSSLRTWIAAIVFNEWRQQNRGTGISITEFGDEHMQLASMQHDEMTNMLEGKEVYDHIASAITQLPENYRTALVKYAVDGLSYSAIAQELHVSEGQVKVWIFRARKKLKTMLEDYI
jgi:RNA polymerase sigma-70 factor (ECF subfamily)